MKCLKELKLNRGSLKEIKFVSKLLHDQAFMSKRL